MFGFYNIKIPNFGLLLCFGQKNETFGQLFLGYSNIFYFHLKIS